MDFAAPVGAGPLTLTTNSNGTYGAFDGDNVIAGTAVIVTAADPARKAYTAAGKIFGSMIAATNATATTVILSGTPAAGYGTLRVYYLYDYKYGMPAGYEIPSRHIVENLWSEVGDLFYTSTEIDAFAVKYSTFPGNVYTLATAGITLTDGTLTANTITDDVLTMTGGNITSVNKIEVTRLLAGGVTA